MHRPGRMPAKGWVTERQVAAFVMLIFCQVPPTPLIKSKSKEKRLHVSVAYFQCKHYKQAHEGHIFSGNTYFHWTQCKNFLLMEFSLNTREKNCFPKSETYYWTRGIDTKSDVIFLDYLYFQGNLRSSREIN